MLPPIVINQLKKSIYILTLSCFCSTFAYAKSIDCGDKSLASKKVCAKQYDEQRLKLNTKFLTAYLVTDAPLKLLHDTQQLWLQHIQQCKSKNCYQQQFDYRLDDLNFYTSMNQTLTQHYLKYQYGKLASSPAHLQIHQLDKDKLKIEGIAYQNPNKKMDNQTISLLAYSTPEQKNHITDNEKKCQYQFDFQKSLLIVKTEQKGCEHFVGIYRLYD